MLHLGPVLSDDLFRQGSSIRHGRWLASDMWCINGTGVPPSPAITTVKRILWWKLFLLCCVCVYTFQWLLTHKLYIVTETCWLQSLSGCQRVLFSPPDSCMCVMCAAFMVVNDWLTSHAKNNWIWVESFREFWNTARLDGVRMDYVGENKLG